MKLLRLPSAGLASDFSNYSLSKLTRLQFFFKLHDQLKLRLFVFANTHTHFILFKKIYSTIFKIPKQIFLRHKLQRQQI